MTRAVADVIEDAEWLDSEGSGAVDAAKRLDFPTPHALEKWLERHDRYDLWLSLKARDPKGIHEERRKGTDVTTIDPIAGLIARGKKSEKARIRNRAERIDVMLSELSDALEAHVEQQKAKAAARVEVERLERQLAAAKAKLRGNPAAASGGPSAAEIRAWAAARDIACPAMGRVPASVVEAYDAAQTEQAS